jgi:hypothetical protein
MIKLCSFFAVQVKNEHIQKNNGTVVVQTRTYLAVMFLGNDYVKDVTH